MAWIGIECRAEPGELAKWAVWLKGAGAEGVAEFLSSAAELLSGKTAGTSDIARMREIERRAAESVERKRADVAGKAAAIVGRVLGKGVEQGKVATAIGLTGFRAGEAGDKNGGVLRKRLAYAGKGSAVRAEDGTAAVVAQKGKCPVGAAAPSNCARKLSGVDSPGSTCRARSATCRCARHCPGTRPRLPSAPPSRRSISARSSISRKVPR